MSDVTDEDISNMEERLADAKAVADASTTAEVIKALNLEVARQDASMAKYNRMIAELQKQVANLRDIRDAIPTTCSRTEEVEQV